MENLKTLLKMLGYGGLAKQLGLSERQVRRYFKGDSKIPGTVSLLAQKILREKEIIENLSR